MKTYRNESGREAQVSLLTTAFVTISIAALCCAAPADGARIISPPLRGVITADTVTYEIEPPAPADSVTLFVRHSDTAVDTLGVFASPPYRALWNAAGAADQDQLHLQFGYIIYRNDMTTISPPTPHRAALDRKGRGRASKKSYRIRQLTHIGAFETDGDTAKWSGVKGEDVGGIARFKMLQKGAKLQIIVHVRDSSITPGDFVELHFDARRDRAHFSGINHRSLRFGPHRRSPPFVAELTDDGFIRADSVNVLVYEETEWARIIEDDGYIIEVAIPFIILSDLAFPPSKIGFDVSVTNVDRVAGGEDVISFHSWAGTERFFRYSPSGWGTARISQAAAALKWALVVIILLTCGGIVFYSIHTIVSSRRRDPVDDDDYSPLTEAVLECVEEGLPDVDFRIDGVVRGVGKSEGEIAAAIEKDLGVTFERLLAFRRLKRSQRLMRTPELDIAQIAALSGFADVETYIEQYKAQMRVDPEISRAAALEKIREEEEERRLAEEEED